MRGRNRMRWKRIEQKVEKRETKKFVQEVNKNKEN